MTCKDSMRVNKLLLPVKFTYFFSFAALGSLFPYTMVYMRQLGLSPSESSTIFGVTWFLTAICRPGFGFMADKWQKHKQLLMLCSILASFLFGCLLFIPPVNTNQNGMKTSELTFFCGETNSYIQSCDDQNCQNSNKSQIGNSTSTCLFSCEMPDAMRSTCISGTAPQGNPQCLSTSPNSSLLEIYMDLGGLTLSNAGIETGACQHVTVVSVYDNRSVISSDVHCRENTTLTCHSDCPYIYEQNRCPVSEALGKFSMTFWLFAFMYFISNIVFAPIANLIDALTYSHLGEERGKWGPQRVWGTIGFAFFGVAAGFAMDAVKRKTGDINYAWCFGFFILHNLLAALSAYFYKTSDDVKCSQPMKKLGQLLKNLEVISLYVLVFALGIFTGIIEALRFWHLQNLGASQLLLGLCLVMQCLPEIVVMFVMGYIIKLLGYHLCLYAACIAYACRFLGYSFLQNPWYVLLIEPLHGLTYAVMYGAASAYGSRLTPEGMHGTMQAMLTTLHFGFGFGVGTLSGGPVFEYYGGAYTFQGCAGLAVLTLLLYMLVVLCLKKQGRLKGTAVGDGETDSTGKQATSKEAPPGDDPIEMQPLQNDEKGNTAE